MNSKKLKELRKNANLTQGELAAEIGVLRETVTRWETTGKISKVYQKILTDYFKN